ncbi:hypothetical protein Bp8pS_020 [Bacillus phage vB_BpuM-BpSp]|nr:hypothetical protein Bp8pS_020 [Bacillus phage vB_BpuM-BpSp]
MGRFAYQPLTEEFIKDSQSGQVIMNRFDGHISVNKNGLIVSKTKELENKLNDIEQLKNDTDEQVDVVNSLLDDLKDFLENGFKETEEIQSEIYSYSKRLLYHIEYLNKFNTGMQNKIRRIWEIIDELKKANEYQKNILKEYSEILKPIADDFEANTNYVELENNTLTSIRLNYIGRSD